MQSNLSPKINKNDEVNIILEKTDSLLSLNEQPSISIPTAIIDGNTSKIAIVDESITLEMPNLNFELNQSKRL